MVSVYIILCLHTIYKLCAVKSKHQHNTQPYTFTNMFCMDNKSIKICFQPIMISQFKNKKLSQISLRLVSF